MIYSKMFVWCKNHPEICLVSTPSVGNKVWSCQLSAFQSLPCRVSERRVCFKSSHIEVTLQCSKTIPTQNIAVALPLLPPPTLFSQIFVGFGSAKGAETPLDCGTSRVAAEKQMLQLKGAAERKAPSEALSVPQALCQRFPSSSSLFLGYVPAIHCMLHAPEAAALA